MGLNPGNGNGIDISTTLFAALPFHLLIYLCIACFLLDLVGGGVSLVDD